MRSVWAMAMIAVRSAVRSRVVLVLVAMLLATIVGFPLTIKGDGTVQGLVQILLGYTLTMVTFLLGIATVWAGCATVSSEIQEKQIHLVVTKPVHRWQIWLGKWLGLLIVNAALLVFSGLVIYGLARWTLRPSQLSVEDQRVLREELLVARRPITPIPDNVSAEVENLVARRMQAGGLPPGVSTSDLQQAFLSQLLTRNHTLAPTTMRQWSFTVPRPGIGESPLLLRYHFGSSEIGPSPVPGTWSFGFPGQAPVLQLDVTNAANRVYTIRLPDPLAAQAGVIEVGFQNRSEDATTIIFPHQDGVELLQYEGSFAANLSRALALIFCRLALLAAVALTAGILLSLPVAALASGYAVILIQFAPYIERIATRESDLLSTQQDHAFLEGALLLVFRILHFLVQPLTGPNPAEYLALGQVIATSAVAWEALIKVLLYSGMVAVIGSWLFNRRELALPGR